MSKENEVIETQVSRTPPDDNIFPLISESPSTNAQLYLHIVRPDGSSTTQMMSPGLGECLLNSGDPVSATIGEDPDIDGTTVLGVWSTEKCPICPFNPYNPVMEEIKCKVALKPNQNPPEE